MKSRHRTAHQLERRRENKRLNRAHRRHGGGRSLKVWAREQAFVSPSEERRALCAGWLARKGVAL